MRLPGHGLVPGLATGVYNPKRPQSMATGFDHALQVEVREVQMISVLIVDDHQLVRQGLKALLGSYPDIRVVAEAGDYAEAIERVRQHRFDVATVNLTMPGRDGLELIEHLRVIAPDLPILALTMHKEEEYAVRALKAGAAGFATKDCEAEQLVFAVRRLASGRDYVSPDVAERLALRHCRNAQSQHPHTMLSNREFRVFEMLVEGKTVTAIANDLCLSDKTVSTHKARLLRKLDRHNQAELIRYAMEVGIASIARLGPVIAPASVFGLELGIGSMTQAGEIQ